MTVRIIFLVSTAFYFSSCLSVETKCCDHLGTSSISKGLYIERYRTFCAGVFGEVTECFLTDSATFRQKIGSYDEHESFFAKFNGDKIVTFNLQSSLIFDTINKKTFYKAELWKYHHNDTNCLSAVPIFGKNIIKCDTDFYPASSYETEQGFYMAQVQYKCGNDYSNAVFFTDSLNFGVFIGVYIPGSFENNFSIKKRNNDSFDFFNITEKRKVDTVKIETFLLADFKKVKLNRVCK